MTAARCRFLVFVDAVLLLESCCSGVALSASSWSSFSRKHCKSVSINAVCWGYGVGYGKGTDDPVGKARRDGLSSWRVVIVVVLEAEDVILLLLLSCSTMDLALFLLDCYLFRRK